MIRTFLLSVGIAVAATGAAMAQAQLCDAAARRAAAEVGVPLDILLGLTRVETGRARDGVIEPWPWTLNMGGPGSWHDSAAAALQAASQAVAEGRRNIDLGCFQINYHWHGGEFTGLAQMLDPQANARYAALFLRDLHAEFGDWTAAAGAFHSRNPVQAERYLARYHDIRRAMAGTDLPADPPRAARGAPASLSLTARPPLVSGGAAARFGGAGPMVATAVRPLWESH